ncbi:MAG TPA: hypothetical protein VMJ10_10855 [Kofleriaceae bacterium]|nr:hypothetical protein [Kofleriaceae bacterium]
MARGTRAPSQSAYQGSIGRTRTETVHVTGPGGALIAHQVHTSIDAVADPELVERLYAGTLNQVDGSVLAVPVVYHDPAAELMVLVLAESHRHRELDERIALLERLRDEHAAIPTYVKDFAVVFGAAGLRAYLEHRAQQALGSQERDRLARDLDRQRKEVDRLRSEARARVAASVQADATTIGPPPTAALAAAPPASAPPEHEEVVTQPVGKLEAAAPEPVARVAPLPRITRPADKPEPAFEFESSTNVDANVEAPPAAAIAPTNGAVAKPAFKVEIDDEATTAAQIIPPGADPLTTETQDLPQEPDPWLDFAATGAASSFHVHDGVPHLALLAGAQVARGLGGHLDVRVLLHRAPTYPVVVLVIGPPAALRVPSPTQLAVIPLDIGVELDRNVIGALARDFQLLVDIVVGGQPIRRVRLVAPLADNVAYIARAAEDHLRGVTADGEAEASFARARDLVLGAGYDLLGLEHAEAGEFRDDKLAQLGTAQAVRRALAIARRFARPSREDYLVCARGFPLQRWRELRRHVVASAVAWGLWMGPELAQVAVSEGLARSRRELVMKLDDGFETLRRNTDAFDIDTDAAEDNLKAIAEEARALGVELRKRSGNGTIKSEDGSVVSGSIERTPTQGLAKGQSVEELLARLDDKKDRVTAASELCDRGDPRAAVPVIAAVHKMSRADAVRILGKTVKLGAAAAPPLTEGLKSSKAFLRHGCALALALLRTEDGTQAVIELLLDEPTEIWREIARAVGQVGPPALMPLASKLGRTGDRLTPQLAERAAWAMAHVGVRGGKPALEQMAAGQSMVAPIAKQALALLDTAARDEVRVRPGQETRDVTVNRAFSRRFFEALEADRPDLAQAALEGIDASGPLELEDGDLIALDEEEAELDESDLIQT